MEEPIETIEYKGYNINIYYDTDLESPRDWNNLGIMICWHNRYNLSDKNCNKYNDPTDFLADLAGKDDDWCYDKTINDLYTEASKHAVILPLYLYDHSGITMSVNPFSCPWDSGQVGYIYATHDTIKKEFGLKKLGKKAKKKAEEILIGEVKTYDTYLTGDVYGYKITDKDNKDIDSCIDSCWGFYGYDHEKSGLMPEARRIIDYEIEHLKKVGSCRIVIDNI